MTALLEPAIATKIRDSFARQGLMASIGAEILELTAGRAVISLPITEKVSQQHGFAHAGTSFAIGDSAAGYAALTLMPHEAEVLTVEMKINLIAPAKGRRLIAVGEVVKTGRRLIVTRATVSAEAEDGSSRNVALLQGTMIPT